MRPGGTQTKHGAAVRMRRRLGLAPRAYVLLSCSLVLVIAGVSAYGMTVPSMVQAHAARELHIGRKTKSDLGTTTGFAWASVVGRTVFDVDPADEGERASNEITLANGKTIVLTNTKIIHHLSDNSVSTVVNKAEQQKGQDTQQTWRLRFVWLQLRFVELERWLRFGLRLRRVWGRQLDGRQHRWQYKLQRPFDRRGGKHTQLARDQVQYARRLCLSGK